MRFPGAFQEAFATVKDTTGRIAEFSDGDAARVGVASDSVGGNLAAVAAVACHNAGIRLAAQLLVSPSPMSPGITGMQKRTPAFPCARKQLRAGG